MVHSGKGLTYSLLVSEAQSPRPKRVDGAVVEVSDAETVLD